MLPRSKAVVRSASSVWWVEFLCKYWDRGHAVRLSMARLLACRAIEGRNEMGVDVNSLLEGHLVLGKGAPLCALSGNGC